MSLFDKLDPTDLIEPLKPHGDDSEGLFGQVRDLLSGLTMGTTNGGIGALGSQESGSLDLGDIAKLFAGKDSSSGVMAADGAKTSPVNPADVKNAAKDALSTEGDGKSIFSFAKGLLDDIKDIGGGLKDIVTGDVGDGLKRLSSGVIDFTGFDNPFGQYADQLNEAGLTEWTDEAGKALFTMQGDEEAGPLGQLLGGIYGSAAERAPSITESLGLARKDT